MWIAIGQLWHTRNLNWLPMWSQIHKVMTRNWYSRKTHLSSWEPQLTFHFPDTLGILIYVLGPIIKMVQSYNIFTYWYILKNKFITISLPLCLCALLSERVHLLCLLQNQNAFCRMTTTGRKKCLVKLWSHCTILKAFAMMVNGAFTLYIYRKSKQNALSWEHIGHINL